MKVPTQRKYLHKRKKTPVESKSEPNKPVLESVEHPPSGATLEGKSDLNNLELGTE